LNYDPLINEHLPDLLNKNAGFDHDTRNEWTLLHYGTSENAVKTQIWTAVCVYVLAAVIKKELALNVSLYTFLQILSVHSFEKIQLSYAFLDVDDRNRDPPPSNQLNLFDS
jgi:hypothetical protein